MQEAKFTNQRGLFKLDRSYTSAQVAAIPPVLDLDEGMIARTTKNYAAVYNFEAELFDCTVTLTLESSQGGSACSP